MAGETLQDSLSGLRFSGADNSYGLGASTLASSLPALINPRSSVGRNLAIGLGGTLLTALLGYQARQQASEDTIATMDYGNQILGASSPEEQFAIATAVEDTQRKAKLLTLVNALKTQGVVDARAFSVASKLQDLKTRGELAAMYGVDPSELSTLLAARAAAFSSPSEESEGAGGAGVSATAESPEELTDKEVSLLGSPAEKAARAQLKETSRKETIAANNRNVDQQIAATRSIRADKITEQFNEVKDNVALIEEAIKMGSAVADTTMITAYERTMNPANMVTIQEKAQYAEAMSLRNQIAGKYAKITSGEAVFDEGFKKDLLRLSRLSLDSKGKALNALVNSTFEMGFNKGLFKEKKDIWTLPDYVPLGGMSTSRRPEAQAAEAYLKQRQR